MRHGGLLLSIVAIAFMTAATALAGAILNQTTPVTWSAYSECTQETVLLQGNFHTVVHFGDSGERVHFGEDLHFTGGKGVGTLTGVRYAGVHVNNSQANMTAFGPQEMTLLLTMNLTRLGGDGTFGNGDDMRVHTVFHLTLNANGQPTAQTDKSRIECV